MKQIQHIISRITLALMRKGCGGGLPKVFQVVLLVTLFSLPNGRAGVGLTFAQELPDDYISTTSVSALAGNKTYVFKHKATGKWLINSGGTLALSDVQPVSSTRNKYLPEIFQTNGEGIISFALTDINDPSTGVVVDPDTEGGILLAPRRNTEAQSATVYVKGNNGLYLTVYKGKVYGVKNTDSNATQWYAYEVTPADHNFVNSACTREGCTAHQVSYRKPTYNTNSEGVQDATKGIASWSTETAVAYPVTNGDDWREFWGTEGKESWYYVSGNMELTHSAYCNGNVHLILCNGAKLTISNAGYAEAGIRVTNGNSLTIYAQSEDASMGELTVDGGYLSAGIGGDAGFSSSHITINGGKVTAMGDDKAAGIGGGHQGNGENIVINGGIVTATGGSGAAGIGGGFDYEYTTQGGCGSHIYINGGTVTTTGGANAAGIGNGTYYKTAASNIYINTALATMAGTSANPTTVINNTGSDLASLLAGKQYVTIHKHNIVNGECTFSGCSLKMTYRVPTYNTAGDAKSGIASWSTQKRTEAATQVTSSTSQVTWNAGWYFVSGNVTLTQGAVCHGAVHLILCDGAKLTVSNWNHNQAGICVTGDDNSLTIYAQSEGEQIGVLEANGGTRGAGIGGGEKQNGQNITINGGSVKATGDSGGAGIGGGEGGYGQNIYISGGTVTATGDVFGVGIGSGAACQDGYVFDNSGNTNNIYINTACGIKAGTSANPTDEIPNNGGDLASSLSGLQYVTVHLHDFDDNGFCTVCGGYQPATQVTASNCEALGLSSAYKDYYAIQNAGQLYWFADKVNKSEVINYYKQGSAVLTADIIINDGTFADNGTFTPKGATSAATPRSWTPIVAGAESLCYYGTFDGNGHTISGLYYKNTNTEYVGFIGYAYYATIKNLGFENMYIHGRQIVGGICGLPQRTTISNCYTTGIIKGEFLDIGGICGVSASYDNVISNCYSTCKASSVGKNSQDTTAGGISGEQSGGISNCYSTQTPAIGGTVMSTTLDEAMVQRFQSGEIAYLLNGSRNKGTEQSPLVWAQNLETQSLPVLGRAGVHYTRTMTDEWGTLVVPFAVSAAPEGFEFYTARSMGDKNELYLRKVTSSIEASTPVFVRRTGSGTSLELTASNETVNTTLATASGTALQGTYTSVALNKTDNPNAYFVYNDLLYSTSKLGASNHVTINPFRAYLVTPVTSGAKQLVMVVEDETTTLINNEQLIINNDGKYLENGRIVILRNGKKYNVNGQVIK